VAVSVMVPLWTLWWLRPVSRAARVGEQSAVVWKRVYLRAKQDGGVQRHSHGEAPPVD
jgi:hypothetical protein